MSVVSVWLKKARNKVVSWHKLDTPSFHAGCRCAGSSVGDAKGSSSKNDQLTVMYP